MLTLFTTLFYMFNVFIIIYILIVDGFYLVLFFYSFIQLQTYLKRLPFSEFEEISVSKQSPPVSVLVPAYNEEQSILNSVSSLLQLNYPEFEVIVINDGSKDNTMNLLVDKFKMSKIPSFSFQMRIKTMKLRALYRSTQYPNLILIDKDNGGKADALNAGINVSSYPYFCGIDADSLLEPNSLTKALQPIIEGGENVVACGGIVRIINGCQVDGGYVKKVNLPKNIVALHQVIEYLRSFLMGRLGLSKLNNLLIISGAFGIFRKKDVLEIGGYATDTVGEDMEIIVRLQRHILETKKEAKVLFVPDPVCWTQAPESLKILYRQRTRWHIGLLETLIKHKSLIFNPRYNSMGMIALPYFLLVELLGPAIELVGTILMIIGLYLDIVNIPFALLFFSATLIFGTFLSMGAILLEEYSFRRYPNVKDLIRLVIFSIVENFWYRQLNSIFRTWAFIKYYKKDYSWGVMNRSGFSPGDKKHNNTHSL